MFSPRLAAWRSVSHRIATSAAALVLTIACTSNDASTITGSSRPSPTAASRDVAVTPSGLKLYVNYGRMCVLPTTGVAKCWGRNEDGQIGDGTTTDRPTPSTAGGGMTFAELALGDHTTCGRRAAGAVYCWGADKERWPWQYDYRLLPRPVAGNDVFAQLTSSDSDGCGITTAGETKCWPLLYVDVMTPQSVPGAPAFVSLTAGTQHLCGLVAAQNGYCWGYNSSGQVGNGSSNQQSAPMSSLGTRRFISLAAGFTHTCGADLGGTAYCWGNNFSGAVGDGTTVPERTVPTRVATTLRFAKVTGGNSHSCGLTKDGAAYCWGNGYQGQVGNGVAGLALVPAKVQGGLVFKDLIAGGLNTCGLTYHDEIYCWGDNSYGQLLDGSTSIAWAPKLMPL